MKHFAAKGIEASRLRQRKYELVRRYGLPENLLGGSLVLTHRRCGKRTCHCVTARHGHEQWLVSFSRRGKRWVERVPRDWVEELEQVAVETRCWLEAVHEVMAINVELLAVRRKLDRERRRTCER